MIILPLNLACLTTTILATNQQQQPLLVPSNRKTTSQPLLGFETWNLKLSPENTSAAVSFAIESGYRQIDGAAVYGNEKSVGKGIADGLKKAGLKRGDIWVTSKLWNDHHGNYEIVEAALNKTLDDLGLEYIDLYLMHWPVGDSSSSQLEKLDYLKTWKSMASLPKTKVLNIGISNFSPAQLNELISETGVKPAVHQMELHPYLQQSAWLATHQVLGINVTGYSPLGNSNPTYHRFSSVLDSILGKQKDGPPPLLEHPTLKEIAGKRNCSTAQVALSWGTGRGVSVIPKSSHEQHIKENLESTRCLLLIEDLAKLKQVGVEELTRFSNPSKRWGVKLFEGLEGV